MPKDESEVLIANITRLRKDIRALEARKTRAEVAHEQAQKDVEDARHDVEVLGFRPTDKSFRTWYEGKVASVEMALNIASAALERINGEVGD